MINEPTISGRDIGFRVLDADKHLLAAGSVPVIESEEAVWAGVRQSVVVVVASGCIRFCLVDWPSPAIPTPLIVNDMDQPVVAGNTVTLPWPVPLITMRWDKQS